MEELQERRRVFEAFHAYRNKKEKQYQRDAAAYAALRPALPHDSRADVDEEETIWYFEKEEREYVTPVKK